MLQLYKYVLLFIFFREISGCKSSVEECAWPALDYARESTIAYACSSIDTPDKHNNYRLRLRDDIIVDTGNSELHLTAGGCPDHRYFISFD